MADDPVVHNNTDKTTEYVTTYRPSLLESIVRQKQRQNLGITEETLPFRGLDVWNAYEFSWLNTKGKPEVAIARFIVPAKSRGLIESKSLKLYLGSFSQTKFGHRSEVISTLSSDLTVAAHAPVDVSLMSRDQALHGSLSALVGSSLDTQDIDIDSYSWDPEFLEVESDTIVRESMFTHLFKSLCPMTGQPDMASIHIQYSGRSISHAGLLRYLVSYRSHAEFAEQVIERIFVDIMNRCEPDRLAVHGYFMRRGGIDINPYRSHEDIQVTDLRLWRQ